MAQVVVGGQGVDGEANRVVFGMIFSASKIILLYWQGKGTHEMYYMSMIGVLAVSGMVQSL